MTRPLDRRNRKWGTLKDGKRLCVKISPEAKDALYSLQRQGDEEISLGAVIEKLVAERKERGKEI